MKKILLNALCFFAGGFIFSLLATATSFFFAGPHLWDEMLNVAVTHIKRYGPDEDAAQVISMARHHAWARRTEMVKVVMPFLADKNPDKVAGAIEVLSHFRSYRPESYIGDFASENATFFADLDKAVYPHFDHFRKIKRVRLYHALALFLATSHTQQAKRELLDIVRSPFAGGAKGQALMCLGWHRDPTDMDTLLPYMLEDSPDAHLLPSVFRTCYGNLATPSLVKALHDAKSSVVRQEAAVQLVLLGVAEGFDYLRDAVLNDTNAFDSIKHDEWAVIFFELPPNEGSKEAVARQIDCKKERLAKLIP